MKILWWSTCPWAPSSYSVLTERVVPDLVRDRHNVILGTWYGLQGGPLPWNITPRKPGEESPGTVTVLPGIDGDNYGASVVDLVYKEFKPDITIACGDVWVFPEKRTRHTNFCPWFPIDHNPAPPLVLDALQSAIYPMAYSRWGVDVLAADGIESHFIPCGAPSDMFKLGDKAAARKGFNEALQAFARFAATHPKSYIYLHTNWDGPIKIQAMLKTLGVEDRAIMPDQFRYNFGMLDKRYMATVYQAADVLLNPAKSEGFGLPLVEAQMCGCPVAATDYSTTDELLFAGWKIQVVPDWTIGAESFRGRATVGSVVSALDAAYQDRNNKTLRLQARRGAIAFDTERVFAKYWRPALAEIEQIVSVGQKVYDFAESFGEVPVQEFGAKADRTVPNEDAPHQHKWAKTGLFDNGDLCVPCLAGDCEAELRISPGNKQIINDTGFSMMVDGQKLLINDDPDGGVAKIVAREIRTSYDLNGIYFSPGDVILDIGAHVGVVSIYLAKKHPDTKIYSFEPDPRNFQRLVENLAKNQVINVTPVNAAVTAESGEMTLYSNHLVNSGGSSLLVKSDDAEMYQVQTVAMESIFEQYHIDRCKLLKIDCEGAEYDILGRAPSELLKRIDHIRGEFHSSDIFPMTPDELLKQVSAVVGDVKIGGASRI